MSKLTDKLNWREYLTLVMNLQKKKKAKKRNLRSHAKLQQNKGYRHAYEKQKKKRVKVGTDSHSPKKFAS